jgi:serine/threonine protein kinase
MAPEIINRKSHNCKVDIWSLGVVTYILLSGTPPFNGQTRNQLFANIQNKEVEFEGYVWNLVSDEAKEFLKKALTKNPVKRASAKDLLKSSWVKKFSEKTSSLH